MARSKFDTAKQLIQEKQYDAARAVLETMPGDPTAQKWLAHLDKIAPRGGDGMGASPVSTPYVDEVSFDAPSTPSYSTSSYSSTGPVRPERARPAYSNSGFDDFDSPAVRADVPKRGSSRGGGGGRAGLFGCGGCLVLLLVVCGALCLLSVGGTYWAFGTNGGREAIVGVMAGSVEGACESQGNSASECTRVVTEIREACQSFITTNLFAGDPSTQDDAQDALNDCINTINEVGEEYGIQIDTTAQFSSSSSNRGGFRISTATPVGRE